MATKPIEASDEARRRAKELGVRITGVYVLRDTSAKTPKPSKPQPVDYGTNG